eukprot:gene4200-4760_t
MFFLCIDVNGDKEAVVSKPQSANAEIANEIYPYLYPFMQLSQSIPIYATIRG